MVVMVVVEEEEEEEEEEEGKVEGVRAEKKISSLLLSYLYQSKSTASPWQS